MTSRSPTFHVEGLQSEKTFSLTLEAVNSRGESQRTSLQAKTTKPKISQTELNQAKIGSLKTRLIISPVLGVLIGVGCAIILVSITLLAIMCFRVKYEKISRNLFGRSRVGEEREIQDDLYVDLTDNSPDLIPSNEDFNGDEEILSRLRQDRKYSTLQSHHFKNDSDYETIKQIHNNITAIGNCRDYCGTLPPRRSNRYSSVKSEDTVIYAKVDKGRKTERKQKQRTIFNTSSDSSVRDMEGDDISAETPLVTSDDGRSSANSQDSKYNGMKSIKYDDRESRV